MTIKALGYRLVIQPDILEDSEAKKTKERATESGIVLPESTQKDLTDEATREQASVDKGVVLDIGGSAFHAFGDTPWCAVGDYIAYARHAGKLIKDPDTDSLVLVVNDEDCICKIITSEKKV